MQKRCDGMFEARCGTEDGEFQMMLSHCYELRLWNLLTKNNLVMCFVKTKCLMGI